MSDQHVNEIVVVDIKMKFWSMVIFMVKWVIASIPAFIILALIWAIVAFFFQNFLGGGVFWHGRFPRPMM